MFNQQTESIVIRTPSAFSCRQLQSVDPIDQQLFAIDRGNVMVDVTFIIVLGSMGCDKKNLSDVGHRALNNLRRSSVNDCCSGDT